MPIAGQPSAGRAAEGDRRKEELPAPRAPPSAVGEAGSPRSGRKAPTPASCGKAPRRRSCPRDHGRWPPLRAESETRRCPGSRSRPRRQCAQSQPAGCTRAAAAPNNGKPPPRLCPSMPSRRVEPQRQGPRRGDAGRCGERTRPTTSPSAPPVRRAPSDTRFRHRGSCG